MQRLAAALLVLAMGVGLWFGRRAVSERLDPPAAATATTQVPSIAIPNARLVAGPVLVGGQPSLRNLREAAEAGYQTVINLRPEGEFTDWDESAEVSALGMRYVSIPVAGAEGLSQENAAQLRAELERAGTTPAIVHCASGNRVGALYALSAFHFDGAEPLEALEIGVDHGLTSLEARVSDYLTAAARPTP